MYYVAHPEVLKITQSFPVVQRQEKDVKLMDSCSYSALRRFMDVD